MNKISVRLACLSLVASTLAAGCGDGDSGKSNNDTGVRSVIAQVESVDAGVLASLRDGPAPQESGGPALLTADSGTVVNGGSSLVQLQAAAPVRRVLVLVRTQGGSSTLDGYWEVELPTARTDVLLQVSIAQAADTVTSVFDCIYAGIDESGRVGPQVAANVRIVPVGTGDLQVSVSWDRPSDVDLHVIEPSGEEIYYDERTSATGGRLDLDSNAACDIDGVNNENITWPEGRAPRGMYTVRVDYWDNCNVSATNYVVTVQRGGPPETFRGTFTGSGDQGDAGSGRTITQFTF